MAALLEASGLSKQFRNPWTFRPYAVLDNLSIHVDEGEIFGLIGPNGAGKTTTFKLLLGLIRPSTGEVRFRGAPLRTAARREIGFLPEQPYFYDHLTVEEILLFYASLYGLSGTSRRRAVEGAIERVQLGPKRTASLQTLSKGTLQRVGIAQAILHGPKLVILDEPMSGLDPIGRHHMRELILSLRTAGSTVIFSSHVLPDAEALCDRVGILYQGRLREVVDLRGETESSGYEVVFAELSAEVLSELARTAGCEPQRNGGHWQVALPSRQAAELVIDTVRRAGGQLERLTPVYPQLEERFLAHVGNASPLD